jgi:hypothetical protein
MAEINFFRAAAGYRMMDHKCNEDIREELTITKYNNKNLSKEMGTIFGKNAENQICSININ